MVNENGARQWLRIVLAVTVTAALLASAPWLLAAFTDEADEPLVDQLPDTAPPQATLAQTTTFQAFMVDNLTPVLPPQPITGISGMFVSRGGDLFVAGQFTHTLEIGETVLTSTGGADIFVARMDTNGSWLWAESAGGMYDDWVVDLNETNDDSAFVNGLFFGEADFEAMNVTATQGYSSEYFAAKVGSDGGWDWAYGTGEVSYAHTLFGCGF